MKEQALKDRLLILAKEKGIHFNLRWLPFFNKFSEILS